MRVKTKILDISLLFTYFVTIIFFTNIWFSIALYFLSIKLIIRGFALMQDSSLFFGVLLLCFSMVGVANYYWKLKTLSLLILYISSFCFASLSVFLIFRQNIHLKVVAIFLLEVLLLVVLNCSLINSFWFWILQSLMLFFVILSLIKRAKYNTRSA